MEDLLMFAGFVALCFVACTHHEESSSIPVETSPPFRIQCEAESQVWATIYGGSIARNSHPGYARGSAEQGVKDWRRVGGTCPEEETQ